MAVAEDLARAVGRLEQQVETDVADIAALDARQNRAEERLGQLDRKLMPLARDVGSLHIEARAHGLRIDDHAKRIADLEAPIKKAKTDSENRRERMRSRIKQVGGILLAGIGMTEWVIKPIVGLIAESWWKGTLPPGGH